MEELELFRDTLEHMPMGILVLDAEGNYLYVNEEYCGLVNKPREFFLGTSIPKLKEMGYLTTSVWEQVMEKRQTVAATISITDETRDRVYDALTIGVPVFDRAGQIRYIVYRQEAVDKLVAFLQTGMLNKHLFRDAEALPPFADEDVVAESPQMKQLLNTLSVVSKTDAAILVTGPSGSGKEVLARRIHQSSIRSGGPLVVLNCAAIPESLMESELFGYEKGAFTGARAQGKKGLIEAADGGTLFLDEINSMPPAIQTKLLRVLETKQVTRLGSVESRDIDFRLVCASNEDLGALVARKAFRSDLFYRINVVSLSIPPLRERKEDILPLALHFMKQFCKKYGRVKALSETAVSRLTAYDWPGNVRELRNAIERAVILSGETEWELKDIPLAPPREPDPVDAGGDCPPAPVYDGNTSLRSYLDECEKQVLSGLLAQNRSPRQMAEILQLNLSNVYRKLQKHHLNVPSPES